MNIQELLEVAKNTEVSEEQMELLKIRLGEKSNEEYHQTTEFLARSYGI